MALTKCKECGKEVSTGAKTCPHCGIKNPGVKGKDAAIGCLVMIVIVGLLTVLLGRMLDREEEPPKTIQELSTDIASVESGNGVLQITLEGGAVLRTKDVMQNASMGSHRIAEKIVKFFPSSLEKRAVFVVQAKVQDGFGNTSTIPVFELSYNADDLKRINYSNLFHRQMLELAEPVKFLAVAGQQAVFEWCADSDNRQGSRKFCATNAR